MDVVSQVPLDNAMQVQQWLTQVLPGYSYTTRGNFVIIGNGLATGVLIKPQGPGRATLQWAFPNIGVQMALTITMVLTGILPGLVLFGIVWLAVSRNVNRMKNELARVLSQGANAPMMANGGYVAPAPSSGGASKGIGVAMIALALMAGAFSLYSYSEYERLGRMTSSSSYGGYGSYGSYGRSYGSSMFDLFLQHRRHTHENNFMGGGVAATLFLAIGIVLIVRKGSAAQPFAQPMQQPYASPQQSWQGAQGYPQQPQQYPPQQAYPQQQQQPQQAQWQQPPSTPNNGGWTGGGGAQ